MASSTRLEFDDLSSNAKELIYDLIEQICEKVKNNNVDVKKLCRSLGIEHDVFLNLLIHPKNDYDGYLDILDKINKMIGR